MIKEINIGEIIEQWEFCHLRDKIMAIIPLETRENIWSNTLFPLENTRDHVIFLTVNGLG